MSDRGIGVVGAGHSARADRLTLDLAAAFLHDVLAIFASVACMALGARERTVVGLVVRHAMILACTGVVLGVFAAYFLSNVLHAPVLDDAS